MSATSRPWPDSLASLTTMQRNCIRNLATSEGVPWIDISPQWLATFSHHELTRVYQLGKVGVAAVERALAQHGLTLRENMTEAQRAERAKREAQREARERAELARLKAKYEPTGGPQ